MWCFSKNILCIFPNQSLRFMDYQKKTYEDGKVDSDGAEVSANVEVGCGRKKVLKLTRQERHSSANPIADFGSYSAATVMLMLLILDVVMREQLSKRCLGRYSPGGIHHPLPPCRVQMSSS